MGGKIEGRGGGRGGVRGGSCRRQFSERRDSARFARGDIGREISLRYLRDCTESARTDPDREFYHTARDVSAL